MANTRKTFKKIIVTDELLKQINPKNMQLKNSFLKEKNTRSSSTTISAYDSDLNIFFTWNLLSNDNKFFIDIKKLEFANFFSYVTDELMWNSARFSRLRACLSSLSQFIEKFYDEEYPMFKNVILKVISPMPKSASREKTLLTEEDIYRLLEHLEKKDAQQACWLALAFSSGARFSELFRFTINNIDVNKTAFDGIFLETTTPIKTKGRTKSGKMLYKYIIKDIFVPYYEKWLIERASIMKETSHEEHGYLFIKKDGSKAEDGTVRSWISGMSNFMGVTVYPHCFRHAITTHLSKIGLPHQLIQEIMGWQSLSMVQIYDDTSIKDKEWEELKVMKK